MYFDNPERQHNFQEEAFYNKTGRKVIKLLESKWFTKTQVNQKLFDLTNIHNMFDYYKIYFDWSKYILKTFELQQMKKEQDCIVVKEHKFKYLCLSRHIRQFWWLPVIWKHKLINIDKEDVTILDSNCKVWQKFDLGLYIESFKKWWEHKMWYLAIPKEV